MKDSKQNKVGVFDCPECDNPIPFAGKIEKGVIIECPACGTESEFLAVSPSRLAPLEEEK